MVEAAPEEGRGARVQIDGRPIGAGSPPYIVAEISANHQGELARAEALLDAAKDAGADGVKLQTFTPDTITLDHDGPEFQISTGPWAGRRLYDLYREASMPWDWHEALFERGRALGLSVFSSPFDRTAVGLLRRLGAPAYKIASFEVIDHPLIACAAEAGKPLILSSGMATVAELEEAIAVARGAGCQELVLLHCISGYPTPLAEANLSTLTDMMSRFGVPVGLSDHTRGTAAASAAVALGACMIEKHFTLSRSDGGLDADFSLEPPELAELVQRCRDTWEAMGQVQYGPSASEAPSLNHRRSLFVVEDVVAGRPLTEENVRSIRPAGGLEPKRLPEVLGRRAKRNLSKGTPLSWEMIE